MSTPKNGRFVWHDLMCVDTKSAIKFYTQLLGWKTKEMDMGPGGLYTMIANGDRDIGGFVPMKESDGVPAHWVGYATVENVDGAVDKAKSLGGKIHVPPTDIPNIGRFAIVGDSRDAVLSPITLQKFPDELTGPPAVGTFCWNELITDDVETAERFYAAIYGWTVSRIDMGPDKYTLWKRGDKDAGGMMKKPPMAKGAPDHWLHYVAVTNVDTSAAKAEGLGAKVFVKPMDIPNVGRFAVLQDPVGASFALFKGSQQ